MSWIDDLEAAILAADPVRVEELLRGRTEEERAGAAPRVEALAQFDLDGERETFEQRIEQSRVAVVALYGTSDFVDAAKRGYPVTTYSVAPVLLDRNPPWLGAWARWIVAHPNHPLQTQFADLRRLIRAGLLEAPSGSEAYTLATLTHLAPRGNARELAREDPELFEHEIWKFFEIEGTQNASLAAVDKYRGSWRDAFLELSAAGIVDRARLLDASLDALERDFAPFRAGWFSSFHEALKPTAEEAAARADRYLALLGSRIPATVSLAMKAVARLDRTGKIAAPDLVSSIAPALYSKPKVIVIEALKCLSRAAKKDPELRRQIAEAAEPALTHESPEACKLAAALAEECGVRRSAALAHASPPVPVSPRQPPSPVAPVSGLDELVETFAAVVENFGPPLEIERVLDGVSRLCGGRPDRFAALTAPLAARVAKRQDSDVAALALSWIHGAAFPLLGARPGMTGFLSGRVREVAERAIRGAAVPLLGAPHPLGLLD